MPNVNLADPLHDEVGFGIHVYSGSWEDGSVGYDKFTNSCWLNVVIPSVPETDNTITHNYPRDLYVLEGIPMEVEDGDPIVLFGPPFSTNPAGWPYWRVSRWDNENQTYIRYGEPDFPIELGLDPPPQQPGMGFWVVQDCEDDCQIEITGTFHEPGDTVRIPLQSTLPDGTPGKNMLANPFNIPFAWGDCMIQRADHTEPPMTIEEAYTAGISCHYSAIWDKFNKQYIIKDLEDTFAPWAGFWTCIWDSIYGWEILYIYPLTDSPAQLIANANPPSNYDEVNDWSFFVGIVVDSLLLVDQCNYLGIRSNSSDFWDADDAPEMAPVVSSGGYVHVYFPHTDWSFRPNNYCFDFRQGPFEGTKTWNFDVRSYQYAGDVLLVWDGAAQITPEYKAALLDESGNILVDDMVLIDTMTVTIAAGEIQHYQIQIERQPLGIGDNDISVVEKYSLSEAYPNPFNNKALMTLSLPNPARVKIELYDVNGRLAQTVVDKDFNEGVHSVKVEAYGLPSGIYFLRASADGVLFCAQKLVLLK